MKDNDSFRYQLISKVAFLYYHEELTQAEIADRLGISRVTVNRMIKEARESGIVEIKIHTDHSHSFLLGNRLSEKYHLRDVACICPPKVGEDLPRLLSEAAAYMLGQRIQEGMRVGVGIGRTISYLPEFLKLPSPARCQFIGLTGGIDLGNYEVPHTFNTISLLAKNTGGTAHFIPAPSYLKDPSLQKLLLEEQSVINALDMAANSQIAIFSVGAADYSALLYQYGLLSDQEMTELRKHRVVGDILGRFFNSDCQEVDIELNDRIIGLHLDQLKSIPLKILVAGGENKYEAIEVALKCGFCDILVTDMNTAEWLLREE